MEIAQKSGIQQGQQWLLAIHWPAEFLAKLCVCMVETRSHLGLDRAVPYILGLVAHLSLVSYPRVMTS